MAPSHFWATRRPKSEPRSQATARFSSAEKRSTGTRSSTARPMPSRSWRPTVAMTSRQRASVNSSGERSTVGSGSRLSLWTTASSSSTAAAGRGTTQSDGERVSRVHARSEVLAGDIRLPSAPLGWGRPLRVDVDSVERLARSHEQAVPLGPAETDVGADLGQANPPNELALGRPDRHAAIAESAPAGIAVARDPEVAVDVATGAVRSALDAVDHEVGEELPVRDLVVAPDVEDVHVALAARPRVARALACADDVELLVVGGKDQAVRIGHLVLADREIHLPARVDPVGIGRQLTLEICDLGRLAESLLDSARGVARPARSVHRALVELAAIGRVGEPVAAVRVRDDVVWRVEAFAIVGIRDDGDRAVVLVADDTPGQVLAGELATLEIEGIAVAIVRRTSEDGDAAVVLAPAQLTVVGDVAPHEIAPLAAPGWPFRPERPSPEAEDRRVALAQAVEHGIGGDNVGIDVGRRLTPITRRSRDGARRIGGSRRGCLGHGETGSQSGDAADHAHRREELSPRHQVVRHRATLL